MNRRITSFVAAFALTIGANAYAQPLPSERFGVAETDQARALFTQGTELYSRGEYEKARAAFSAAWALRQHWQIAGNLGGSELRLKLYPQAAEHLTIALRLESKDTSALTSETAQAQVARLRAALAQAKEQVATIEIAVDAIGAEVLVDRQMRGLAPLTDPVFVEPGWHEIEARADGKPPARSSIDVARGATTRVNLKLAEAAPSSVVLSSPSTSSDKPANKPGAPATALGSSRPTTLIGVAGGLAVLAAGAAIYFDAKSSSDKNDAESLQAQSAKLDGPNICHSMPALPTCMQIADAYERAHDSHRTANIAWISAGVLGATALGAFLFWRGSSRSEISVGVAPTPSATTVTLSGGF